MLPMTPAEILNYYGLSPASPADFATVSTVIYRAPALVWPYVPYDLKLKALSLIQRFVKRQFRLASLVVHRSYPGLSREAGSKRVYGERSRTISGVYASSLSSVSGIDRLPWNKKVGLSLITVAIGAFLAFYAPVIKLEVGFWLKTTAMGIQLLWTDAKTDFSSALSRDPVSVPKKDAHEAAAAEVLTEAPLTKEFDPLVDPVGNSISPVNNDFALVIPSVGINATIVPGVNPVSRAGYMEALKKGVAHSSLSYYPNENGTVYLFSHSTNYEWFIDDLNAIFYHLKNIEPGQLVVVMYQGNRYTYQIREKKVISAREISYLVPQTGARTLILQTCWPPGTAYKRLLIFADLIDEKIYGKFKDVQI